MLGTGANALSQLPSSCIIVIHRQKMTHHLAWAGADNSSMLLATPSKQTLAVVQFASETRMTIMSISGQFDSGFKFQ